MIKIQDLKKSYGDLQALKGISFEVKKGEILGLLGPNGAGKTTTMKIMMGFLDPSYGTIIIDNLDIQKEPAKIQRKVGYLPENTPLYSDLNVYEHLDFIASAHELEGEKKEKAIKAAIQMTGLSDRLFFNISELSKGYRQRVGLAQALIHDPAILILDEPTTGLDPNQIIEIRDLIKHISKEKTIILSSHIMQEVEATCDRVVVLHEGRVVAEGTPNEIKGVKANEHTVRVVIGGTKKAIEEALSSEDVKVEMEEALSKGIYAYIITSNTDKRADITNRVVKANLKLLEITNKTQSMEQAFQQLTK